MHEYSESIYFKIIAKEWLEILKPELKESSVVKYANILDCYLLPKFGSTKITDISRKDVSSYCSSLLTAGGKKKKCLSPKTINGILSVLRNIFDFAAEEKNLQVAVIDNISMRQPQKAMRVLSRAEQYAISKYLCQNLTPCNLGILLCLYTGLRIGEICALRWEDISVKEHYLHVQRTMQRMQTFDNSEKRTCIRISTPKSECSVRTIPIPEDIFRLLAADIGNPDSYLLTGSSHYIEPRTLQNRFKVILAQCGISGVSFHTLRHTFATRCVEVGFDIKSLSEILGHASVSITMNRYVHPSMELKQKNMNKLTNLWDGG